jgi:hypothetical protein
MANDQQPHSFASIGGSYEGTTTSSDGADMSEASDSVDFNVGGLFNCEIFNLQKVSMENFALIRVLGRGGILFSMIYGTIFLLCFSLWESVPGSKNWWP